ncbi:MAG: hypothetical protein K2X81_21830, partial [Candidatus Obscuribacterales bacterium]|nr:hypothetical protein [Candidatus Obscuribacterales bacterium]
MKNESFMSMQSILESLAPQAGVFSGSVLQKYDHVLEELCQSILCLARLGDITTEQNEKIKAGLLAAREISLPSNKTYGQSDFGDWEFELYSHSGIGQSLVIEEIQMPRYVLEFSLDNDGVFYQGAVSSDALALGPVLFFMNPKSGKLRLLSEGIDIALAKTHELGTVKVDFWTTPPSHNRPLVETGQPDLLSDLFSSFLKMKNNSITLPPKSKDSTEPMAELPPMDEDSTLDFDDL